MSNRKIILFVLAILLVFLFVFLFSRNRSEQKNGDFIDAPESVQAVSGEEIIKTLYLDNKDEISAKINSLLNKAYLNFVSNGGNFTDYLSDDEEGFKLDFGMVSSVQNLVNDSLFESVDFFGQDGKIIKSSEELPQIKLNNKQLDVSDYSENFTENTWYLVRYFDYKSIYTPYYTVFYSSGNFSVGDLWVISSNESYFTENVSSENDINDVLE